MHNVLVVVAPSKKHPLAYRVTITEQAARRARSGIRQYRVIAPVRGRGGSESVTVSCRLVFSSAAFGVSGEPGGPSTRLSWRSEADELSPRVCGDPGASCGGESRLLEGEEIGTLSGVRDPPGTGDCDDWRSDGAPPESVSPDEDDRAA